MKINIVDIYKEFFGREVIIRQFRYLEKSRRIEYGI